MASWISIFLRLSSLITLFVAISIGTIASGIPRRLGFYRWLSFQLKEDALKGLSPAFLEGVADGYTYARLSKEANLTGQTAIVTGANSGLGYWSSYHLSMQGANVIMACRNPTKCEAARSKIADALASNKPRLYSSGSVTPMVLDTSILSSVRSFADTYTNSHPGPINMLLLNAGVGKKLDPTALSPDGIELIFATNHVGHHLLYKLLFPQILQAGESSGARVVLTSSSAHYSGKPKYGVGLTKDEIVEAGEDGFYAQSKLAQVLFAQEAARRLDLMNTKAASNVFVNSCHPGMVDTSIWIVVKQYFESKLFGTIVIKMIEMLQNQFMFSPEEGALTQIYLAAAPEVATLGGGIRGRYFHPQAVEVQPHAHTKNMTLQTSLWDFTESLVIQA
mmetsp:Transcript_32188/g.47357  ORF Transcript_32188/g.47357 Transcript_32188/m.47357 type:complete len:392 (-) Transcript_32188:247-1422(-)|eukprot:CAMPEP_0195516640 /NCGR_PEP_ID=MMETSP0794_2-20130614/8154_1 /TAXON_ID=515487 /ORGANISM="Stephanopyxis turris, Strain CCMP 815" /LENGTH=391 /DNA_ID=CAMNT_0040645287 /DNA_START=163 /DNA_END=1338 /DNA_ORIENTATION=+